MTADLHTPLFAEGTCGKDMRISVSRGHRSSLPKWEGSEINYTVVLAEDVDDDRYIDKRKETVLASLAAVDLNAWPLLDRGTLRRFAG